MVLFVSSQNSLSTWICHSWSFRSGSNDFVVDGLDVGLACCSFPDYEKSVTYLLDLVLAYHCSWRVGGAWKPMPGLVVMEMVLLSSSFAVSQFR
ncbi:hypothetical protein F2Q70_00010133 [Brassica cretica]|uniref:Uncharacterized protein n=1 Tax=Brassica cretica TaxID=69181 RepID=A0A8S9MCI0_BRACR|nr:hypothetical protein F2Q70_00010133 [Brassica cretica]